MSLDYRAPVAFLASPLDISPAWLVDATPIMTVTDEPAHIGFASEFKVSANLPIALRQFEADLDTARLKSFQATCP